MSHNLERVKVRLYELASSEGFTLNFSIYLGDSGLVKFVVMTNVFSNNQHPMFENK